MSATQYVRHTDIPEYKGEKNNQEIRAWLLYVNMVCDDRGVTDDRTKIRHALHHMKGGPTDWASGWAVRAHDPDTPEPWLRNWDLFYAEVLRNLGDPNAASNARLRLESLRQNRRTVANTYNTDFRGTLAELANAEGNVDYKHDQAMMWQYRRGLRTTIQTSVSNSALFVHLYGWPEVTPTLARCMELALQYEAHETLQRHQRESAVAVPFRTSPRRTLGASQGNQLGNGNGSQGAPPTGTDQLWGEPMDLDAIVVNAVQQLNAIQQALRTAGPQGGRRPQQNGRRQPFTPFQMPLIQENRCFQCKQVGHTPRDCQNEFVSTRDYLGRNDSSQ